MVASFSFTLCNSDDTHTLTHTHIHIYANTFYINLEDRTDEILQIIYSLELKYFVYALLVC